MNLHHQLKEFADKLGEKIDALTNEIYMLAERDVYETDIDGNFVLLFRIPRASVTEIDISTEAYSTIQAVFEDADVIYFTGGNSFFLMDRLRKTGTDGLLKKELANGKLMIGESAGAIICAPTIQYIEQMDEKPEDYSQEDNEGLDLIDFYVLPHYLTAPFKKITERIIAEFSDLNICAINNHQAIIVNDEGSKVICKD